MMREHDFGPDTRGLWDELARERGFKKLPAWKAPATASRVRTWCHRLGVTGNEFHDWAALSIPAFLALNATWPLRAVVGLLLEAFPTSRPLLKAERPGNR